MLHCRAILEDSESLRYNSMSGLIKIYDNYLFRVKILIDPRPEYKYFFCMFSKVCISSKSKNLSNDFFPNHVLVTTSQSQTWPWTYVNSVHTFKVAGKLNLLQMHEGQLSKIYWILGGKTWSNQMMDNRLDSHKIA